MWPLQRAARHKTGKRVIMLLGWFDTREASNIGTRLADQFASHALSSSTLERKRLSPHGKQGDALREFLQRAERIVHASALNFYKKAKLANAFKWRLLEKGVESAIATEVTESLVMHLSMKRLAAAPGGEPSGATTDTSSSRRARDLLAEADGHAARGAYAEAVHSYQAFLERKPRHARALNNLGAAYWRLGRYVDAEQHFREAIRLRATDPDAHNNLGGVLRGRGHLIPSENSLRRALKLNPAHVEARASLGLTLVALGRPRDAQSHFERALKVRPAYVPALLGMATIASIEGRFSDAEALVERALQGAPDEPSAWATLPALRKMTVADKTWLRRAEDIVSRGVTPLEEADLRFAMGKYCDDIHDFASAFHNYARGNALIKANTDPYDRSARSALVDNLTRTYTSQSFPEDAPAPTDSARISARPVLVTGMMRSGTSLVEQIIASHPAAAGAGELDFWSGVLRRYDGALRQNSLPEPICNELAHEYLRTLTKSVGDFSRIVDKTPANSDYLGLIYTVLPRARIIYVKRDPVDTCLSCYFQAFTAGVNFTRDLSDLAHYYRTHRKLIDHWRAVLPRGTILDVPYEDLVTDQETWTRKILDFLGLEWNERCLNFQDTQRCVATASSWQVRQKIYTSSLNRRRNYERFIEPLLELRNLTR